MGIRTIERVENTESVPNLAAIQATLPAPGNTSWSSRDGRPRGTTPPIRWPRSAAASGVAAAPVRTLRAEGHRRELALPGADRSDKTPCQKRDVENIRPVGSLTERQKIEQQRFIPASCIIRLRGLKRRSRCRAQMRLARAVHRKRWEVRPGGSHAGDATGRDAAGVPEGGRR